MKGSGVDFAFLISTFPFFTSFFHYMAFTNPQGRTQTSLAEINVVPLVDVVLVLLIIFMLTAPIIQSGIEINVPKTKTVKELTQKRLVVSINRAQHLFLESEAININELEARLKEKIKDPAQAIIYLRADEEVPFGTIAKVMDRTRQAGVENINVVTQPYSSPKK